MCEERYFPSISIIIKGVDERWFAVKIKLSINDVMKEISQVMYCVR